MSWGPSKFYFVLSFVFLCSQAVHPAGIRSSNYFSPSPFPSPSPSPSFFFGGGGGWVLFGVWIAIKQLRLQIDTFWRLLFDEGTKEEVKSYQRISWSKEKGIYAISLVWCIYLSVSACKNYNPSYRLTLCQTLKKWCYSFFNRLAKFMEFLFLDLYWSSLEFTRSKGHVMKTHAENGLRSSKLTCHLLL